MEKTENLVLETIARRRSVRGYKPEQISPAQLQAVLTAGQYAPYVTEDSRHFTVLQNQALIRRLAAAAKTAAAGFGDQALADLCGDPHYDGTYGAPTVVVVSGNEQALQYEAICAASVQNMLLAATAVGLGSCWTYFAIFAFQGPRREEFLRALDIPEGYNPCAAVLLGYPTEIPAAEIPAAEDRYRTDITFLREPPL
jgi:nitroreductase